MSEDRPRHHRSRVRCHALVAVLAWTAGCGGDGPARVTVTGVVTQNGQPLEGAAVQFLPDPGSGNNQSGEATTDTGGGYRLATVGRSGVVPGQYHVVISKFPPAPAGGNTGEDPSMGQMTSQPAPKGKSKGKGPAPSIPGAVEAAFDRLVPPEGGTFDFEVNPSAPAPAK